jgi:ABC-type dipeptide/oligopeptide/nickel transport system permease component
VAVRIVRRTAEMLLVVFGVVTIVFFLLRIAAGDPAQLMTPPGTPVDVVQQTRERLGTDRPLLVQYGDYLADLSRGDLGRSFHGGQPVRDQVLRALPNTAALALVTVVVASSLGLLLGIAAALRANGFFDRAILVYVAIGQATPAFWLAVVLVLVFAVQRNWLPAIDMRGPRSFVLPVATLAITLTPILIRIVRQSFLETLGEDFVRAARARGLPERRVVFVHGLKVASLPLVTLIGLQAGFILAGSYVVEYIFNWPGIGKLTLDSLSSRNFPMIQGAVIVAAAAFVVVNFVVDLVYSALDPRIRLGGAS